MESEEMKADDFQFLRSAIWSLTGIALSNSKKPLIQSRLRTRVQELGLESYSDYSSLLQHLPPDHPEWQVFTNSLTTNKTDWFREPSHFEFLVREFIPRWKHFTSTKQLSLWSAACSSGEEPYTLSMILNYAREQSGFHKYRILATDIDTEVLRKAQRGIYHKSALNQIPQEYHNFSFTCGTGEISHLIKVRSALKQNVSFQQYNLIQPRCPWVGEFDVIFCRNVFIYFSKDVICNVLDLLYRAAAKQAVLFIGHSESLQGASQWRYIGPSIYSKGRVF